MGCWVSKNKPKKTPNNISRTHHNNNNGNSKSPPPTHPLPEEEETVKEVLSESTISKPKPKPKPIPNPPTIFKKEISPFIRTAPLLSSTVPTYSKKQNAAVFMPEDFSDLGSTVSVSESLSLSNVTEKEVFHEVRQKSPARFNNNNRSFSGEVKREGKSPGRRSEQPSPERFGSGYVKRRESGESSGRRSRSPVTCVGSDNGGGALKPGLGRSLSSRKTGKSPSRVGSGLGERIRKMEEGGGDKKWAPTSNDTLENPLVSLECFIFL